MISSVLSFTSLSIQSLRKRRRKLLWHVVDKRTLRNRLTIRVQFKELKNKRTLSNSDLPILIAKYHYRLKQIVTQIKRGEYESAYQRQREEQQRLDYRLIREREKEALEPSTLAIDLQRRLLDIEKDLLEDEDLDSADLNVVAEIDVSLDAADGEDDEEEDDGAEDEGEDENAETDGHGAHVEGGAGSVGSHDGGKIDVIVGRVLYYGNSLIS